METRQAGNMDEEPEIMAAAWTPRKKNRGEAEESRNVEELYETTANAGEVYGGCDGKIISNGDIAEKFFGKISECIVLLWRRS